MITPAEIQAYHGHPAWSATKIKAAAKLTPLAFWAAHIDPQRKPFEPTDAMKRGSLCDAVITKPPAEFQQHYAVIPPEAPKRPTAAQINAKRPSLATVDAIDWWREFECELGGREPVTESALAHAWMVAERLQEDPVASAILTQPRRSTDPHYWMEGERNCRFMPDIITESGILCDLKIARSANPHHFKSQSYQLGYDIQMAHYERGYIDRFSQPPSEVSILAYEWEWPHDCCYFVVPREVLDHGHERRLAAIESVEACEREGKWPSYGERALALPGYVKYDNEAYTSDPSDLDLEGFS